MGKMRHFTRAFLATAVAVAVSDAASMAAEPGPRRIGRKVLEDKIRGGWAGKMIGVAYGGPTEFKAQGKIFEGEIVWSADKVASAIDQDDLYVGMTLAETMDRLGLDAPVEAYGEAFKQTKYSLWHANAGARRLLNQGVKAPLSGHPKYNIHANDIDFQIEADFIGLMTPGLPRQSNDLCDRVGRVMNHGDGVYGGMFLDCMYSAAFFERDPRKVVEQGLACLPPQSGYAGIIQDVLSWSAQHPGDWRKTWGLVEEKWDKDDPCPDGALRPFNIDARINGAYIALGLLYGAGDFAKTLEVSTRAGQDSDCNPSSAAGVLGVMLGYSGIPEAWKSGIPAVANRKFAYTSSSLNDICQSTLARALKVIERSGGRVGDGEIVIPYQAPAPAKLEQWDMGVPDKRLSVTDAAWTFKGAWGETTGAEGRDKEPRRSASEAGAEATLSFTGAAVAILGDCSQEGGRAEVFLDDRKMQGIDAYIVERTHDNALWHVYGLQQGSHTLRIVSRGDADPRSKGRKLTIREAVVYRAR
jgi:hypothetical protein